MNLLLLSALSLLADAALAQDYFPLQTGNQWVYRSTGTGPGPERRLSLEITESREINDNTYYRLTGFGGAAYWLRWNDAGALVALDSNQQSEQLWYDFAAAPGSSYDTAIPYCCGRATVVSRNAAYQGPLGGLNNALELAYPGVFQVGLVKEQFLPSIGLAYREENTGGASMVRYELAYARVRGVNVFTTAEFAFRLSLDQTVCRPAGRLTAHLAVVNTTGQPLRLTFPSSQRYDLSIRDASGNSVYHWSADKLFAQVIETVDFRGETHWFVSVPLGSLTPGQYTVEAWLTSQDSARWRALARFAVASPQ